MNEIKVGQRWKEVDPRYERVVEIIEIASGLAKPIKIRTVSADNRNAIGRSTYASRERFNGKRGGYKLVEG